MNSIEVKINLYDMADEILQIMIDKDPNGYDKVFEIVDKYTKIIGDTKND